PVGKDDEVAGGVEDLAGAEEDSGKTGAGEILSAAGGAVEDHDCVGDFASGVGDGLAVGGIVEIHFREDFAGTEAKVVDFEIALLWLERFLGEGETGDGQGDHESESVNRGEFHGRELTS